MAVLRQTTWTSVYSAYNGGCSASQAQHEIPSRSMTGILAPQRFDMPGLHRTRIVGTCLHMAAGWLYDQPLTCDANHCDGATGETATVLLDGTVSSCPS